MKNVIQTLMKRGLIQAVTDEALETIAEQPLSVYCGFDPTAESLHVGNLVAIMGLAWFQKCGHTPIAVVGGATGLIGDPSGRSKERNLLSIEDMERNLQGIKADLSKILDFKSVKNPAKILNNYDWFASMNALEFLRDVGKHFRLGSMLAKESVKSRLESDEGLSYTEFSYQLLQAFDFFHLSDHHNVTVQLGGSDQWGNITAGIELTRKIRGKGLYGLTLPLLTRTDGQKFGKTQEGAVWLSQEKLSPYHFYQYFIRVNDKEVSSLLRKLTFLDLEEIEEWESESNEGKLPPNELQRRLATELTTLVHGPEGLEMAMKTTKAIMPGADIALNRDSLKQLKEDMPSLQLLPSQVGISLIDLLLLANLVSSKSEARRVLKNGGIYLNNGKIETEEINLADKLIDGRYLVLAVGKKNKVLIDFSS